MTGIERHWAEVDAENDRHKRDALKAQIASIEAEIGPKMALLNQLKAQADPLRDAQAFLKLMNSQMGAQGQGMENLATLAGNAASFFWSW